MEKGDYERIVRGADATEESLTLVIDELAALGTPWSGKLRIVAIGARAAHRRESAKLANKVPARLVRYSITINDGRPLHQYRLAQTQYDQLQADLRGVKLYQFTLVDAALFVLWASEWFRRCYGGGGQRWADLGEVIDLRLEQHQWRHLADTGLRWWGIPAMMVGTTHHRLAAIARQGGFPLAALAGVEGGWAAQFLNRLVAALAAEDQQDFDRARAIAAAGEDQVPSLWRHEEMLSVCAELAVAVVALRREAEAAGIAPDLVSAWLERERPGWRDELPLTVDDTAGRRLVDQLMSVAALKGGWGSVRAERVLRIDDNKRTEWVRLMLDGKLIDPTGHAIPSAAREEWSRLRVGPAGPLARHLSEELALAEPDPDGGWQARALGGADFHPLPLNVPVTVELRAAGERVGSPFTLPGGEPATAGLRVCVQPEHLDDYSELTVVGLGSGAHRAQHVVLDLPPNWTPEPVGESECLELDGEGADGRALWTACGTVRVRSPRGDLYLVRTGQAASGRDELALIGDRLAGTHDAGGRPILRGVPRIELREMGKPRNSKLGESWWRPAGERHWRPLEGEVRWGACEFAWREAGSGIIRDRRDAIVLPPTLRLHRERTGAALRLTLAGWLGRAALDDEAPGERIQWSLPIRHAGARFAELHLFQDGERRATLCVERPHQAGIARWDDRSVPPGTIIGLAALDRFVARAEGHCLLMADLLDRDDRVVPQGEAAWRVDDELPMSAVREQLAGLLRPLEDDRARVRLNFNDGHEDYWFVSEFEGGLDVVSTGLVTERAVVQANVRVIGRALSDPRRPRDFGTYTLLDELNHRPIRLPALDGDWLITLNDGERVLTRPKLVRHERSARSPSDRLGRAMALSDREERRAALDAIVLGMEAAPASADTRTLVVELVELATTLGGLPPATFDVFRMLTNHPLVGCLMLFGGAPDAIEPVLALADGLLFDWSIVPLRCWDTATAARAEALFAAMPDDAAFVAASISSRRRAIVATRPYLAGALNPPGRLPSVHELSMAFINRADDRADHGVRNPMRPAHEALLPRWTVREGYWRALDAPLVAALAARERVTIRRAERLGIKDVARRHPRWFAEALTAALQE